MKFVYQFDVFGKLIKVHLNIKETSINTKISESSIMTSNYRKQLVNRTFYFSYDKNFKLPEFSKNKYVPLYDQWRIFGLKKKKEQKKFVTF